jgi:hypothetical protein
VLTLELRHEQCGPARRVEVDHDRPFAGVVEEAGQVGNVLRMVQDEGVEPCRLQPVAHVGLDGAVELRLEPLGELQGQSSRERGLRASL